MKTTKVNIINVEKKYSYPEIGDTHFKFELWAFKQQSAFKMPVHCRISIVLL